MAPKLEINEHEALLIHEIARHLRTCFDRRAQHLGLTRSQWQVLGILRRHPEISQTELAARLEVEPITLGRLLDRMERAGWISRKRHPTDRRANQVTLTPKVQPILKEMMSISNQLRKDSLEGFSEIEYANLMDYLRRLKANIGEIAGERCKKDK